MLKETFHFVIRLVAHFEYVYNRMQNTVVLLVYSAPHNTFADYALSTVHHFLALFCIVLNQVNDLVQI